MEIQTTKNDTKIAKVSGDYSPEQIAIIKNTVAKGVTDLELAFFINLSQSLGLNPFNKEIWCYKDYKGNLISFSSRDGFLKMAQKNPLWNGIVSSEVRENDFFEVNIPKGEINHKPVYNKERGKIIGAYCYVKPKGCETATIEWADFSTYNKNQFVWKSHPAEMIKKVAEIKALKKAFGIAGLQNEDDFEVQNDKVYAKDTEGVDYNRINYAEQLMQTSTIDDDEKYRLEKELKDVSNNRMDEIIEYLLQNQLDPLDGNYSQSDFAKTNKL